MKHFFSRLCIVVFIFCYSCEGNSPQINKESFNLDKSISDLNSLSDNIDKLNSTSFFFGHQSVGKNIIEGIEEIQDAYPQLRLNFKETTFTEPELDTPVFLHASLGQNTAPHTKIADFVKAIDFYGDKIEIAFLKFCYVDINMETNIQKLFDDYVKSLNNIKIKYPKMKLIHYTVPLTTKPKGIRASVRVMLNQDVNIQRNKFNKLIRKYYPEDEIFDLAKLESTYPNGKNYVYRINIPGLIAEYTYDGGHLNEQGRLYIATKLLEKLLKTAE